MKHTAKVIRDVNADVLGVVEADSRPVLKLFSGALLKELGATPLAAGATLHTETRVAASAAFISEAVRNRVPRSGAQARRSSSANGPSKSLRK